MTFYVLTITAWCLLHFSSVLGQSMLEDLEKIKAEQDAENAVYDWIAVGIAVLVIVFFFLVFLGKLSRKQKLLQDKAKQPTGEQSHLKSS